jgi:hypothetical protein
MKLSRTLGIIGASLTVIGSFLPWEREGDLISVSTYGLRTSQTNVYDNGGVLVILLTLLILFLTFNPHYFVKNPNLWNLIASILLMAASLFFMARWLIHYFKSVGITGSASLEIGLIAVMTGSALLLWMTLINNRQAFNKRALASKAYNPRK